ncbi:MAG TPA: hypothetical protein VGP62_13135 [Bryobacteraceae bacterium]|jgi:hypothetical protein|nr:hypothetical protein [Bryobacteraceae bacterium]
MSQERETRNEKRETKLTRRELALAVSTSAVLLAQAPAPLPSNPDEELKAVKDAIQQTSQQLAKFDLPMSTEPAVHFRA